jgi:hypothetical protein
MRRGWFVGWSAFVGISWVALAAAFADDQTCSYICFTFRDMLVVLLFPAMIVWPLGLIVLYIVGRSRKKPGSSGDAETTTRTQ